MLKQKKSHYLNVNLQKKCISSSRHSATWITPPVEGQLALSHYGSLYKKQMPLKLDCGREVDCSFKLINF